MCGIKSSWFLSIGRSSSFYLVIDILFNSIWSKTYLILFLIFYVSYSVFYDTKCGLFWCMCYPTLRRMCVLVSLGEVFYKCQWSQFYWWCFSSQVYVYWFALSIDNGKRGVEYPTIIIVSSIISFKFYHFLLHMFWHSS